MSSHVSLFDELLNVYFADVPQTGREYVVNVAFPNCSSVLDALASNFRFNISSEYVCKGNRHFCTHGGVMYLKVVLTIELKSIFFEDKFKHLVREGCFYEICCMLRLRVVSNFRDSGEIHARARKWAPARRRATRRGAEN